MRSLVLFVVILLSFVSAAQTTDAKGRKQGYWKKTDDKNKLIYEGEFKDDQPVGRFKYYYPNDSVRAIMNFSKDGKTVYAKLFHPGGKRMAEGKYINKEIKDSTWLFYDELGVLISKDNYKLGKKNGVCIVYLPDGKVAEERRYKDDVRNGESKEYFNDGAIKFKGSYVSDLLEGRVSYYYPNGVEVAAGYYKKGLRNGPWVYKTESGKIREKELYKNGETATAKETEEFFAKNKIVDQPAKGKKKTQSKTHLTKGVELRRYLMSKHGKVLVAMSGGIDSSVAAMMLHEQGYEVIGITMKTWDYESSGSSKKETGCCSLDSINDARSMAVNFGFPHYILDIRGEFGEFIINNFVEEYLAGRTPNPCVLCNTHIKWDALLKRADMLDCEFIATGHYAQIRKENKRNIIFKGVDHTKDQTYVLWGLGQDSLKRTMFPLGNFRKTEIKQMAKDAGFFDLANKSESYDICFVPDNNYREFLKHRMPDLEAKVDGGDYIFKGKNVGKHRGYPFYTVGQRKGLDIALGAPVFVKEIIPETNTVILGDKEDLEENHLQVRDFNIIKYDTLPSDFVGLTKIRYKDPGTPATINIIDNKLDVIFHSPVNGVAPGQSAVIYEGDDLVGGGFIDRKKKLF